MDFGGGDIAAAIRIIADIYRYGFSEDNAADTRFINFWNDVRNFEGLLKTLNDALRKAHQRYGTELHLQAHRRPLDPLAADFDHERIAVVGNFCATLDECKNLLESKKKYLSRRSNPLENLGWHLLQEEQRTNDLRQRLAFHMSKIRFVIDRLSLDVLSDLDANLDDAVALAEENRDVSNATLFEVKKFRSELFGYLAGQSSLPLNTTEDRHLASPAVVEKFQQNLRSTIKTDSSEVPLNDWFDALLYALEQSNDGSDQTPENYLAFIKARWLMDTIKGTAVYKDARPGFYLKRACNQIDRALQAKIRNPDDLFHFQEPQLLALPAASFAIWKPMLTPMPTEIDLQLTQPQGVYNEVAKIQLATNFPGCTDTLTILKRSDLQFRAVRDVSLPSSSQQVLVPLQIDVGQDHLVPRYLLPTLAQPCLEMSLFSRGSENAYRFQDIEGLYHLQSTLTGFEISHDQRPVICQFSDTAKHLDCDSARIQLWQEPLEDQDAHRAASNPRKGSAGVNSGSQSGSRVSIAATTTVAQTVDGFEAQRIKRCAIVMVSEHKSHSSQQQPIKITFVALPEDSYIEESLCACHRGYDTCSKLVLARPKKKPFPVRFRYCDLLSFDLLEFRTNSNFQNASLVETDYLRLKFPSLADKIEFHKEMKLRFRVRNKQLADQRSFGARFRQRQDRPQRAGQESQQLDHRRSSNLAVPSQRSPAPPQLPVIDSGPVFSPALGTSPSRGTVLGASRTPRHSQSATSKETNGPVGTDADSAIEIRDPMARSPLPASIGSNEFGKWDEKAAPSNMPVNQGTNSSLSTFASETERKSKSTFGKLFRKKAANGR